MKNARKTTAFVIIFLTLAISLTYSCPTVMETHSGRARLARLKVSTPEDLFNSLKFLTAYYPGLNHVLEALQNIPQLQQLIQDALWRWPELPNILKGLEMFLTGPDGKAILEPFQQATPYILQALVTLHDKTLIYFEEAGEVMAEQGVRLFFGLRNDTVVESLCKLRALLETRILAVYLEEFDVNLEDGLDKLEKLLSEDSLPEKQNGSGFSR